MRSAFVCVSVGVAVLLAGVPQAAAQAPVGDSVTGDLFDQFETGVQVFDFDARSGPAGENPTGLASWHVGGGLGPSWSASVSCLAVSGTTAVIGFSGTLYFMGELSPDAGLIRVVDGGGPQSGQDSFEWAETTGVPGGPVIPGPTECSSYPAGFPPSVSATAFNRTGGNLIVSDATTAPTSKDQCKNGGWRNFPGFKNQGDCVSWVATGGRNQPSGH
jgi:hypothetical protein